VTGPPLRGEQRTVTWSSLCRPLTAARALGSLITGTLLMVGGIAEPVTAELRAGPVASSSVFRLMRIGIVLAIASVGLTGVVVAATPQITRIARSHEEVPLPVPDLAAQARRSIVYDNTGKNITDIFKVENREPFSLDSVPKPVVDAVLAVEDADFWRHDGVNGRSVMRALLANVASGSVEQGGSTITQQVVKNLIMNSPTDRSVKTKLVEAVIARRLEKKMGKKYVLEQYLNTVYFGNNAYGLQSAAEVYFGKNVDQLTMVEGAFLGGMIRNPADYDPFVRPERARYRLRQALDRVAAEGEITPADAEAQAAAFVLPTAPQKPPQLAVARSYFTDAVKDYLLNNSEILGKTYQDRYNALFRGGLRIYTTQDLLLEQVAENARKEILPENATGIDAALVSVNTRTGAIVAMRGGPGFGVNQVNLTERGRQTGSAFKFVILTAALAAGAQPNDLINGQAPCVLPNPGDPKHPFEIGSNDERVASRGVAPLTVMTWSSINCAFGRLAQIIGLNRVVDFAHKLGMKGKLNPYPSLATGNNEVTPLDMASAYQTIANQGVHIDPYMIEKIVGPDGHVVYQHEAQPVQVISPAVALTALSVMKGVLTNGTGRNGRLANDRPAAGKTGTQAFNTNAWFVGATPAYTAAVWVGDPKGQTRMRGIPEFVNDRRFGGVNPVHGGDYPVRIWKYYMDVAHWAQPNEDWPAPPPLSRGARRLFLPGEECVFRASAAPPPAAPIDPTQPAPPPAAPTYGIDRKATGSPVPGDVTDIAWPLPSAPAGAAVFNCKSGPPPPTPAPAPAPVPAPPP
jgi:membrane peptidoglycan carboxypeptidase